MNENKHLDLVSIRQPKMKEGVSKCPNGCHPGLKLFGVPPPDKPGNAVARCLQCLVYWEVTPAGKVIKLKQGLEASLVPEALLVPEGEILKLEPPTPEVG